MKRYNNAFAMSLTEAQVMNIVHSELMTEVRKSAPNTQMVNEIFGFGKKSVDDELNDLDKEQNGSVGDLSEREKALAYGIVNKYIDEYSRSQYALKLINDLSALERSIPPELTLSNFNYKSTQGTYDAFTIKRNSRFLKFTSNLGQYANDKAREAGIKNEVHQLTAEINETIDKYVRIEEMFLNNKLQKEGATIKSKVSARSTSGLSGIGVKYLNAYEGPLYQLVDLNSIPSKDGQPKAKPRRVGCMTVILALMAIGFVSKQCSSEGDKQSNPSDSTNTETSTPTNTATNKSQSDTYNYNQSNKSKSNSTQNSNEKTLVKSRRNIGWYVGKKEFQYLKDQNYIEYDKYERKWYFKKKFDNSQTIQPLMDKKILK